MNGIGTFCFCDDIEKWKDLYSAILFIDILVYKDYDTYDKGDLERLKAIYIKYQDSEWKDEDFFAFQRDFSNYLGSYVINFSGKVSQLFELDSDDEFIASIHSSFSYNPKENENAFLKFLDGYTT